MLSVKNVHKILDVIFRRLACQISSNHDFLKDLGFTSSNDRGVIKALKYLGFLDASGKPQDAYVLCRSYQVQESPCYSTYRGP